ASLQAISSLVPGFAASGMLVSRVALTPFLAAAGSAATSATLATTSSPPDKCLITIQLYAAEHQRGPARTPRRDRRCLRGRSRALPGGSPEASRHNAPKKEEAHGRTPGFPHALPAAGFEQLFGRQRRCRESAHRVAQTGRHARQDLSVLEMRGRLDDRLRALLRVA